MTQTATRPESTEAIARRFTDAVEHLAFSMPAPNPWTPQFMSLCVAMRNAINSRAQDESNTQPALLAALQGVAHHNAGLKDEFKLSPSLMRQVNSAIAAATGGKE